MFAEGFINYYFMPNSWDVVTYDDSSCDDKAAESFGSETVGVIAGKRGGDGEQNQH